jgi:tripartite-type tricarboxylate transporter receptor subunit TctC
MARSVSRRWRLALVSGLLAASAGAALAQAPAYPAKPVQIIVPFSAGGDADQSARNLAAHAQALLGQPLVIVNRAGANGAIGSQVVKDAPPDGYTLLLARVGSQVMLPALQPKSTSYKWNDFTFLGLLDLNPVVCVVNTESPYRTLADLAAAMRDKPGKLTYSHSGPATVQNLAAQLFIHSAGLKPDAAVNVPYKGGGEVALAVISKEVDFACNNLSSMAGQLSGGKLRALVTTTPKRLEKFPDLPTAREAGYPQLEAVVGWSALYGPPKMDGAAVARWSGVLKTLSEDAKWIAGNGTFGGIPSVLSPAETEKFVEQSFGVYQALVQKTGLEIK